MLLNSPRLNDAMTTYELAAMVAVAPENVLYTSGFWCLSQWIRRGPQAFVVVPASSHDEPVIITSTSTLDLVADQGVTARVRRYGGFIVGTDRSIVLDSVGARQAELYGLPADDSAVSGLVAEIRAAGLANSRIGIDELGLLPGDIEALKSALPEVTWVSASSVFRWVRAVKTAVEIARLKAIGEITERSISAALAIAKEGVTELEMARVFHRHTVGEDALPVLGCIGFGER
ncbi:MAG: aminopeptidase P family N-terminal domain-containing protein, partial [Rhizobium pusense]|nr:aminopeptidase P family N-terminal domain-containing protein [Agrobacterium pusense]